MRGVAHNARSVRHCAPAARPTKIRLKAAQIGISQVNVALLAAGLNYLHTWPLSAGKGYSAVPEHTGAAHYCALRPDWAASSAAEYQALLTAVYDRLMLNEYVY